MFKVFIMYGGSWSVKVEKVAYVRSLECIEDNSRVPFCLNFTWHRFLICWDVIDFEENFVGSFQMSVRVRS